MVQYEEGTSVQIDVVIGGYAGQGSQLFPHFIDYQTTVCAAQRVGHYFCASDFKSLLIPPERFASGVPSSGIYAALGGPGVGKTTERLVGAVVRSSQAGHGCLMLSTLRQNRNQLVEHLHRSMGTALFDERVRVVGARDLSDLASTRTLEALVAKELSPYVAIATKNAVALREASVLFRALQTFPGVSGLPTIVVALIDSFGGFFSKFLHLHFQVARERCRLEQMLREARERVLARCTTVIGTIGALRNAPAATALKNLSSPICLICLDESTRTSVFDLHMLMLNLGVSADTKIELGIAGDPCQTCSKTGVLPCAEDLLANNDVFTNPAMWILGCATAGSLTPKDLVTATD